MTASHSRLKFGDAFRLRITDVEADEFAAPRLLNGRTKEVSMRCHEP